MAKIRLRSLDGARGLAAIAVVLAHAQSNSGSNPFFRGQPAVDLFFTLSGFVISLIYLNGRSLSWKSFAVARFARIYPLHIVTASGMALLGVIYAMFSHKPWPEHVNALQGLRELTLTMTMPVVGAMKLWNFPAWSISVEWWVYFTLFPIIFYFGSKVRLATSIVIFGIFAILLAIWMHSGVKPTRYEPAFSRALLGFAGGWISWRLYSEGGPTISDRLSCIIAVIFPACATVSPFIFADDAWFLLPFYPVLVYSLTQDTIISRILSRRMFVWLGTVSYSIYLIHPIVLNLLEAIDAKFIKIDGALMWMSLTLPTSLIFASASYCPPSAPMAQI